MDRGLQRRAPGRLLKLRWSDIDWHGSALTISRARSAGTISSPKSRKVRRVTMCDPAAQALERLSRREDFTAPDELVLVNPLGRAIDGSALRKRFQRAATAIGFRPLTWHHLRHTFGSQLVASGIDLMTVQDALGHAQLSTTSRYLHARPATKTTGTFTWAFAVDDAPDTVEAGENTAAAALLAPSRLDADTKARLLEELSTSPSSQG